MCVHWVVGVFGWLYVLIVFRGDGGGCAEKFLSPDCIWITTVNYWQPKKRENEITAYIRGRKWKFVLAICRWHHHGFAFCALAFIFDFDNFCSINHKFNQLFLSLLLFAGTCWQPLDFCSWENGIKKNVLIVCIINWFSILYFVNTLVAGERKTHLSAKLLPAAAISSHLLSPLLVYTPFLSTLVFFKWTANCFEQESKGDWVPLFIRVPGNPVRLSINPMHAPLPPAIAAAATYIVYEI